MNAEEQQFLLDLLTKDSEYYGFFTQICDYKMLAAVFTDHHRFYIKMLSGGYYGVKTIVAKNPNAKIQKPMKQ